MEPATVKTEATRLSAERTRLSYDRTLMSWIRTATSLISFGFTVYKFFQIEGAARRPDRAMSATQFAVLMIVFGLLSLLLATLEHRRDLNALRREYPDMPRSLARVLASLISLLGIIALVTVLVQG